MHVQNTGKRKPFNVQYCPLLIRDQQDSKQADLSMFNERLLRQRFPVCNFIEIKTIGTGCAIYVSTGFYHESE
jgi:hypothetical protein